MSQRIDELETIVRLARRRADEDGQQTAFAFLADDPLRIEASLTWAELDRRARAIAAALQALGAAGERVMMLYPPGLAFVEAFLGCLYAGAVAVPAYLPEPSRIARGIERLRAIAADCTPAAIATTQATAGLLTTAENSLAGYRQITTDTIDTAMADDWKPPAIDPGSLAFLQYTSGSTATPKGVMVRHDNLFLNTGDIANHMGYTRDSVAVSWLPVFHDMGLIIGVLVPLRVGLTGYLMSPITFLRRPAVWPEAMSTFRGTNSGAPNFAYDLCVRKTTEAERAALDLRTWRLAYNGAEPVRPDTLARFADAFAVSGLPRDALFPCYGLAEGTLMVSGGPGNAPPTVWRVQDQALQRDRVVRAAADQASVSLVGCGRPCPNARVAVVERAPEPATGPVIGVRCAPGVVGEIWVQGGSVAGGYWQRPEETERAFAARIAGEEGTWLRTGDLGFLGDGELFITGRSKDVIIIAGRNHYPQDIERTVEASHPALRPGCCAAFGVTHDGEERVGVAVEISRGAAQALDAAASASPLDANAVIEAIREAVWQAHDLTVHTVALLRPGTIPKTSSGKIQRRASRDRLLAGRLGSVSTWTWGAAPATQPAQPTTPSSREPAPHTPQAPAARSAADTRAWLVERLAAHTGQPADAIDIDAPFARFHLASRDAVGISGELSAWLGRPVPATALWEHPTIRALSAHLAGHGAPAPQVATATPASAGIAVVGLACRFPGADSPEAFWRLLRDGVDAIREVPPGRWDAAAPDPALGSALDERGRAAVRWGGFLDDVAGFDARFFQIAPREAQEMDPQHRLLLEVAWEAIERGGHAPSDLAQRRCGVFVAVGASDYALLRAAPGAAGPASEHTAVGNLPSLAAGRLSYALGLTGPSLTVDTACSSSLVAVHMACRSLRTGECDVAVVGGANLILTPHGSVALARRQALSPTGRCRTFDADANGYVRGEGCGVLVLARLDDALARRDRVWAVIRGTAVNNDGRTYGLTAPSATAQEAVIRQALADAGADAGSLQYVEAHGTGTPLGDPIEVKALAAALHADRPAEAPVWMGSVKTNIGHLEAAAGVAGLIKLILSLQAGEIPPHLHLRQGNPEIPWDRLPLRVPAAVVPWPQPAGHTTTADGRRRAGISSFGFSGTNAHVIVEEAPPAPAPPAGEDARGAHVLCLSARTENALGRMLARLHQHLVNTPEASLPDICYTAARREHFAHRAAIAAQSRDELLAGLEALAAGRGHGRASRGRAPASEDVRIAFLFSGQGGQRPGMGRELYRSSAVFRDAFDACARHFRSQLEGLDPTAYVLGDAGAGDARLEQPALFCLQYALVMQWRDWGIEPAATLGHSLGEYAAAWASGALAIEDAARLVATRARLMHALPGRGAMAAVMADEPTVARHIAPWQTSLALAAINAPHSVVVSGAGDDLDAALGALDAAGIEHRRLAVTHAFHSPQMDPMLAPFGEVAAAMRLRAPRMPWISSLTGHAMAETQDGTHFQRQLREPVRFQAALETMAGLGCHAFLEIGPSAALVHLGRQCLPGSDAPWVASLRERRAPWPTLLDALARLYTRGAHVDWHAHFADVPCRLVDLPGYPLEHERFWLPDSPAMEMPMTSSAPASTGNEDRILDALRDMLAGLLHLRPDELDPETPLLEMGADSLALLQAITTVDERFHVRLSVRQIFEELPTLRAVARYLHEKMPAPPPVHATPAPAQPPAAPPALQAPAAPPPVHATPAPAQPPVHATAAPAPLPEVPRANGSNGHSHLAPPPLLAPPEPQPAPSSSGLQEIFARQLDAMSRLVTGQLEVLRGLPAAELPLTGTTPTPHHALVPPAAAPEVRHTNGHARTPAPAHANGHARASAPAAPTAPTAPATRATPASTAQPVDARQRDFLARLAARYNARTARSKEHAARYRGVLSDLRSFIGFRPSTKEMVYPLVKGRARGARIWDIDGNEYIDLTLGFGVHLLGHAPAVVEEAIRRQVEEGIELGPRAPLAGPVAERLCRMTGFDRAAFCVSGTDAVHLAIRLARAVVGRPRIAMFRGAYHGHGDATQARIERIGDVHAVPSTPGVPQSAVDDVVVLDYGSEDALRYLEAHVHELGAVLVEPVQSRYPAVQPAEFLQAVRALTREAGTALIFDEMITGFRIHPGGAQAWFGVQADLATYGKILGGGLPIGAVTGQARFLDRLDGGRWRYGDDSRPDPDVVYFGSTYAMHPLAMAAANAVLTHLEAEGPALQAALNARTEDMARRLDDIFTRAGAPIHMVRFGSLFRFEFTGNRDALFYLLAERGVYIWEGRSCFLSTAHTDADVDHIVSAVEEAVREMQDGGLLPPPAGPAPRGRPRGDAGGGQGEGGRERGGQGQAGRETRTHERETRTHERETRAQMPWKRERGTPSLLLPRHRARRPAASTTRSMDFGLFYFGSYDPGYRADKYRLLVEGARFADQHGFRSVWLPERHFHAFGGISPNPSVVAAALARETRRVHIRAGSVVLPLHHPVRVAEEWAVVDNLSGGRVGLSFATGWHAKDFLLAPDAYEARRDIMFERVDVVRRLWRGQPVAFPGPDGRPVEIEIVPRPRQTELPCWIAVVGNPDSYARAGELGAGVLTSLLGQSLDDLAARIALYHEVHERHHGTRGHVAVLLHTFVGPDLAATREQARAPFQRYLEASAGLFDSLVRSMGHTGGFEHARPEDVQYLLEKAYERYVADSALIGTPDSCADVVAQVAAAGADEICCLVDFGIDDDTVLAGLEHLDRLRQRFAGKDARPRAPGARSIQSSAGAADRTADAADTKTAGAQAIFPATAAQRQLFALSRFATGGALAYNLFSALDLHGPIGRDAQEAREALARALATLSERHESLRTTFGEDGKTLLVHARMPPALVVTDLADLASEADGDRDAALAQLLEEEGLRPVDLLHGPVLHTHLIRLGAEHHVLVLRVHHALVDGWSLAVLAEELVRLHAEACGHTPAPAAAEPAPRFQDHVAWQHERAGSKAFAADEAYWLDVLRAPIPDLTLPADRPPPAVPSFRGGRVTRSLTVDRAALAAFGRKHGLTPFMILCGSFAALLHRWTGQDDLLLGVPAANRRLPAEAGLIGYCTNILPLRTTLEPDTSALGFLGRIRAALLDGYEHQHLPFAHLVERLRDQRDPIHAPLVRVVFNLDHPLRLPAMGPLSVRLRATPVTHAHFDLAVNVLEEGERMWINCDFGQDRLTAPMVERLVDQWQVLLASLIEAPQRTVTDLPLMGRDERAMLLDTWGTGAPPAAAPMPVHRRIAEQAARAPEAVALTHGDAALTNAALTRRVRDLAARLRDRGVGPEVPVAVYLPRSPDLVVAVLAILEAGGAFVPLDTAFPARRLAFVLSDAGAHLAVTREDLRHCLPASAEIVTVEETGNHRGDAPGDTTATMDAATRADELDRLAYILYTSGSTGAPKGIEVTHGSLARYLDWAARAYLGHGDCHGEGTPLHGSLASDATLTSLFLPLMAGQTIDIISDEDSASSLARALTRRATPYALVKLTPTHLRMLDAMLPESTPISGPDALILGGEQLDAALARRWRRRMPGTRIFNEYGPTEATVGCTVYQMDGQMDGQTRVDEPDGPVPIGRPIDGARIRVLDPAGQPVPIGVAGELHIGGTCLARGYRGRPALTAERFAADPAGPMGARLYRTGDRARWREDGQLVFLGRNDDQVKIRGHRVELGEVENALAMHPAVRQCAAGVRQDAHGDDRLVAWLVPQPGAEVDPMALREHLRQWLPPAMLPSHLVPLAALPVNTAGKIDRQALPSPLAVTTSMPAAAAPPRTELERRLLAIWSRALDAPHLSIHDRFLDHGGDSLLAVRLAVEIGKELDVGIEPSALLRYPTVAALARALGGQQQGDEGHTVLLRPGATERPLFLVHPLGGHLFCYRGLCQALGGDRAVIGLRAHGIAGGETPVRDIATLAEMYLEEVRAMQPHGPYLFAGWSFGGVVAFEMARHLRAQGERVALTALIDAHLLDEREVIDADTERQTWVHILAALTGTPPEQVELPASDGPVDDMLGPVVERLALQGRTARALQAADLQRYVDIVHAHVEALRGYAPPPLPPEDAGVLLLCTRGQAMAGQIARWRRVAPGVRVVEMPGDHFTLLRADVALVASRLDAALART